MPMIVAAAPPPSVAQKVTIPGTVRPAQKSLYLDVLRGAAIGMVFLVHLYGATFWRVTFDWTGYVHDFSESYHKSMLIFYPYTYGSLGVTLFFVLSGYCIHLSFLNYLKRRPGRLRLVRFLRNFYIRRFFRIYPAYLAALALFIVWTKVYLHPNWKADLFSHLVLLHNLDPGTYSSINGAFWSLAYEWQLYCLYPIILLMRSRVGMAKAFVVLALGSMAYSLVAANLDRGPFALQDSVLRSKYFFTWILGAYLCEVHAGGGRVFPRGWRPLVLAAVASVAAAEFGPARSVLWEVFAVLFAWILEGYRDRAVFTRVERWVGGLGVISYSVYLIHGPLIEYLIHGPLRGAMHLGYPYNQLTVGGAVLIFLPIAALGWVGYRLIEKPCHEFGGWLSARAG